MRILYSQEIKYTGHVTKIKEKRIFFPNSILYTVYTTLIKYLLTSENSHMYAFPLTNITVMNDHEYSFLATLYHYLNHSFDPIYLHWF